MYRTILVPLDKSKRAEAILPHVEELARCFQAKIVLLTVIEPVQTPVSTDFMVYPVDMTQYEEEARHYLADLKSGLEAKGITVETCMMYGPVVHQIIEAASQVGADLIAMASHGRTGLAHVFYGSVAAGVLHRIDRPLILVRSEGVD